MAAWYLERRPIHSHFSLTARRQTIEVSNLVPPICACHLVNSKSELGLATVSVAIVRPTSDTSSPSDVCRLRGGAIPAPTGLKIPETQIEEPHTLNAARQG